MVKYLLVSPECACAQSRFQPPAADSGATEPKQFLQIQWRSGCQRNSPILPPGGFHHGCCPHFYKWIEPKPTRKRQYNWENILRSWLDVLFSLIHILKHQYWGYAKADCIIVHSFSRYSQKVLCHSFHSDPLYTFSLNNTHPSQMVRSAVC